LNPSQRLQLLAGLLNAITPVRVDGAENTPAQGGLIVIANHADLIDAVILELYAGRELCYVAKAELFTPDVNDRLQSFRAQAEKMGVPAPALDLIHDLIDSSIEYINETRVLPIVRGFRGRDAEDSAFYYERVLEKADELLKAGKALAIFPEGRRSDDGALQRFKGFAARIALRSRAPILPTAISGAFGFADLNRWVAGRKTPRAIHFRIGTPINPAEFPEGESKEAIKALTRRMHAAVAELLQAR
jgi:1-acyl-sn-glycerol-3-phosphate acyltransferase